MAYEDKLGDTQQETFAELFEFTIGDTKNYYTSHRANISFAGNFYLSRPLHRSNFKFQKKLRSVKVTISASIDPIGLRYVANAPPETIKVKITRVFLDGSEDNAVIFEGEVISITLKDRVAHAEVEASLAIFRNKIPRQVFQAACNWMLFSTECGLNKASYKTSTVVTVTGSTLVSSDFATKPDGYFTMGHVEKLGDYRLITHHVGNTITIHVPFDSRVYTGVSVDAYPGCDGHYTTCQNKFSNYSKFFGFIAIPRTNPVVWGLKKSEVLEGGLQIIG